MGSRRMHGLSLIEMMIAMLLGCLLMLGVVQLFIDNQRAQLFHQGQSEIQASGRFTSMLLEQELVKTGYNRRPDLTLAEAFPAATNAGGTTCSFAAGQTITAVDSKTLCIRYHPRDAQETDCLGNGRATNSYSVAKPYSTPSETFVEKLAVGGNQLTCTSGGTSASLLEGISDIRFEFGVTTGDDKSVSQYKIAPASSDQIVSIRYAALLSSTTSHISLASETNTYANWYGSAASTPTDGRLYQVLSGSVMLRNLMP